jgi:transglutaminase-like putative cysteine protease
LGNIGRLKTSGEIVIRLEAKKGAAPSLLREASYPNYRQQTWYADISETDFERVREETDPGTFVLLLQKTNQPSAVRIGCYLGGGKSLLPLPEGAGRLEHLVAYELQKSGLGAVLAQGPGLVIFDAFYGPGSTIDAPANTNSDLSIPPREMATLDKVASELKLDEQTQQQVSKTLAAFFQQRFTYSTWQDAAPPRGMEETPLARFLLHTHTGHCEYFATAGVLLLRRAGIPARYAVGYAVHERAGRKYVVRQRDAHTWCLVWDGNSGSWRDFDPTPASWLAAEANRASPWQSLSDLSSRIAFEVSKFRWRQSHVRKYLFWVVAPVLAALLCQIIFHRWRRGRAGSLKAAVGPGTWPGLDSEFFELETKLVEQGFVRQPSEPLSDWVQRSAADPKLEEVSAPLRDLLGLHYRHRFDPQGLTQSEREALRREARLCLEKIEVRSRLPNPTAHAG